MGGFVRKIGRGIRSIGRAVKKVVSAPLKILAPEPEQQAVPEPTPAAPTAPTPETQAQGAVQNEGISRKKKRGRAGLRVDLQTGGSKKSGLNIPNG